MSIRDPHDRRVFRHFAKVVDGIVAAVVEVAAGATPPTDGAGNRYVDITPLYPIDVHGADAYGDTDDDVRALLMVQRGG